MKKSINENLKITFSIVIIAYNEEKTIPNLAESAKEFMKAGGGR